MDQVERVVPHTTLLPKMTPIGLHALTDPFATSVIPKRCLSAPQRDDPHQSVQCEIRGASDLDRSSVSSLKETGKRMTDVVAYQGSALISQ